jgi:hypothetical protein
MSHTEIELIDLIADWFARDPIGPLLNLPHIAEDPPSELAAALEQQLSLIPSQTVQRTRDDHHFRFFHSEGSDGDLDRKARIWILSQALSYEIPRRRLQALQAIPRDLAVHPALDGVSFDDEGLVALSEFEPGNGVVIRGGHAFTIAPPVESCNASYWLTQALASTELWRQAHVRLDPFLFGPVNDFETMHYRMWWWGKPCTWTELQAKTGHEPGAWLPGPLTRGVQHTDYNWVTDAQEGHLEIEELHKNDRNATRGTRYLHAIYDRAQGSVIHLDGAIRVLSDNEWLSRSTRHLKNLGKIGQRIKIFRVDGVIDDSKFAPLSASFFVWNLDIARFFGADISEEL